MCLSHPTEGYYMKSSNAVFGARGDFITSPEISQVFGELVGIWLLSQYISVAQGQDIRLVELGPGRGTLMDDILRTLSQLPASRLVSKEVHLVETSVSLRAIQEQRLKPWSEKHNIQLYWHTSLDDIPEKEGSYTMLVAHEFFDALPIHLIEKTQHGWQEVLLSSSPDPAAPTILRPSDPLSASAQNPAPTRSSSSFRLRPVLASSPSPISTLLGSSSPRFKSLPVGSRIEVSPASFRIARKVGEVIGGQSNEKKKGSALIIDYGDDKAVGNSFRGFKDHKIVDPFHLPGHCDLTANVDFAYLREAMANTATPHGPLTQHAFLTRMGLSMRVDALKRAAKSDERKQAIESSAQRLADMIGMGREYKVLGVTSNGGGEDDAGRVWPFLNEDHKNSSTDPKGSQTS
ncbi:hypothetical protein EVG20_g11153 [Dentipellis fragilis]|uniref:Protein arginine methyltransferase NDUFAF7 n=1 Tax=Dentipellis fragilis TaxID=205917 RepID=A0A4Y9XM15_9AGAM|nr:hypothetical protein EVG20_g11153 [Dentipellis fragilis]